MFKILNMAVRKVFSDENGNEMSFWLNTDNDLFIEVGQPDEPKSFISLDRHDLKEFINDLSNLERENYNNG